jgi:hypothetical protein
MSTYPQSQLFLAIHDFKKNVVPQLHVGTSSVDSRGEELDSLNSPSVNQTRASHLKGGGDLYP